MSPRAAFALPGLLGSHPLGALAAFGLLRWLNDYDAEALLRFELRDDWVAVVETSHAADLEGLIEQLSIWAANYPPTRLLEFAEDVRMVPADFRKLLHRAIGAADETLVRWLGSLIADGAVDRSARAAVKPSAFYMVSGQQKFLGGLKEILAQVRSRPQACFLEALAGPWRYQTRTHSLGWDPGAERVYALRGKAPTGEKPVCIPAAMLLAVHALDLFPTVSAQGYARTTAFVREANENWFQWPVFDSSIGVDSLRSLLHTQSLWNSDGARRHGIAAVFRSRRMEFGQGYGVLRPAQPFKVAASAGRKRSQSR